jgi:hypothetical protein
MTTLFEKAGASFLRAFIASAVLLIPGILNAPNKTEATALAIAASYACFAAGLRAIQVFVPALTTGNKIVDSFLRAALGTLIASLTAALAAPDFGFTKALLLSLLIGAATAGVRALQAFFTSGDTPAPNVGIVAP